MLIDLAAGGGTCYLAYDKCWQKRVEEAPKSDQIRPTEEVVIWTSAIFGDIMTVEEC